MHSIDFDIIVIGGGLFGSIIAKELKSKGATVLIIDANHPNRGSNPAGCLMKPSWLTSFHHKELEACYEMLDTHYGLISEPFHVAGRIDLSLKRILPEKVLTDMADNRLFGKVSEITQVDNFTLCCKYLHDFGAMSLYARRIIVATGVFSPELTPWALAPVAQGGWAAFVPKTVQGINSLQIWAPYRQLITFDMDGQKIWSGDGTALKITSMDESARLKVLKRNTEGLRASNWLDEANQDKISLVQGYRPYVKQTAKSSSGKTPPVYIHHRRNNEDIDKSIEGTITVVNGGAKNGTIGAAWAALQLRDWL